MFPCGWCGNPIDSYAAHFDTGAGRPCQIAARTPAPQLVMLDAGHATDTSVRAQGERNRIRNASKRRLERTNRADRIERLAQSTPRRQDAHHEHRMRTLTQPPG